MLREPRQIALPDEPKFVRTGAIVMPPVTPSSTPRNASMPPSADDEGRDAEIGDQPADQQAARDAEQHHRRHGAVERPSPPDVENRRDAAEQTEQRADRQIDLARDDDEHHAAREHAGDRHLPQQVGEVARGDESPPMRDRSQRAEEDPDDGDGEQQREDLVFGD